MKLIKLDAIDSTNVFLKDLSNQQELEDFTVVTTENQTKGKGQMGASWVSEKGKNLIMSIFVKKSVRNINHVFNLNIAVALAIVKALEYYKIPNLSIKWPNDIMSDKFKIGGILIENSIKSDSTISSIIGLGLNVNQINFENLPKASSLALVGNSIYNKEELLVVIVDNIKENLDVLNTKSEILWFEFTNRLFKKGVPMPFKNGNRKIFMGIIKGITSHGKLQVLLEDDTVCEYGLKEIEMLY